MAEMWNDLLSCLELRDLTPDNSSDPPEQGPGTTAAVFEGQNQNLEYHRLFGGQILGQFIAASLATSPDKSIKSIHSVFSKEGRADEAVTYRVVRQQEGRTFASLLITAYQSHGVIASAAVSMHASEDGPELQEIPSPSPLLSADHTVDFNLIPWETRSIGDLDSTGVAAPEFEFWMRTPAVDAALAPALAAYATDLTLIGTALLPLDGYSQRGNGTAFVSAVTSHTIWFHRPFRTDEWLLLRQHSPLVAHARTFGRGDILTADGALVASFAQEAMVRIKS
jgi:acyl-CoA thioesterase II